MKNWSRRHTLIGGLALILLTNAVALVGVAWNRSGNPESVLKLTQRELTQPYWRMNSENSGISLRIHLRDSDGPGWLDEAKLTSLGFDLSSLSAAKDRYEWARRQPQRDVLLVLEMDGQAYQQALQRAKKAAADADAKLAADPDDKTRKESARWAHEGLKREQEESSRLFVIDAGLDLAALRAKYPDRGRYAIVRALVRPSTTGETGKIGGYIEQIIDEVNVPHGYQSLVRRDAQERQLPFEATVAFGQRLEPWLLGVSATAR